MRRQGPVFLVILVVVVGLGVGYDIAGGVRWPVALLFWSGVGLAGALAVTFVLELSRSTITSLSSLGKHRGYAVLGAAPELAKRELRGLPPDQRSPLGVLAYAPASAFATAFRDLQGGLAEDKLVSFIGPMPGEGATTVALCAAASATQQGRNVIIVDCDLRRRSLSRGFGFDSDLGVLEACERPEYWRDYVEQEAETGLNFLAAAKPITAWRTLLGAAGFPVLLKELQNAYDLVILDCPPALGSAEGAMLARLADRAVVVTVWDQTRISAVRETMRALKTRSRVATGVYVNRVPPGYRFGRLRPD